MLTCTHQAKVPFALFVRHLIILIGTAVAVTLLPSTSSGQTVTGSISGTITDPNGAVVAGAAVTLGEGSDQRQARPGEQRGWPL
jgi:hypothetical protein